MTPSAIDLGLIDGWQRDFPLTERPFAEVGRGVGLDEAGTIAAFRRLRDAGVISRIGAVVKPHSIGASTLAAMRVPPDRLDAVAAAVSAEPLVNHNYERTHEINLWFVIAGPNRQAVADTIGRIERDTGLAVLDLPLLKSYHIDLGFALGGARQKCPVAVPRAGEPYRPDKRDRDVLAAIEDGLPLIDRPYRDVAERLGLSEGDLLERLRHMAASGALARFGCVVRHRALGYTANAMAVWNVDDGVVDDVAKRFARHAGVTLCYCRPRLPDWPYNLFCMVHAKSRREAYVAIDDLNLIGDTGLAEQAVLFSTRCFKQRGAVFSERAGGLN